MLRLQSQALLYHLKRVHLAFALFEVSSELEALFQHRAHHLAHIGAGRIPFRAGFDGIPTLLRPLGQG